MPRLALALARVRYAREVLLADDLDALDAFVSSCLFDGGVWDSPRESDGIPALRVLERSLDRLRLCGSIYTIDQVLHAFWLDLGRDGSWVLYFDVVASTERKARNAVTSADRPEDVPWRVVIAGEATIHGEVVSVVAGSTRVQEA